MAIVDGATIRGRSEERTFSDIEVRNTSFKMCHLPGASSPGDWNKIGDVALTDVSQWNCSIDTTAIEDVSLHNLKRSGSAPLFLWGCVFRHVRLSGRLSGIKINRSVAIGSAASTGAQSEWDRATIDYYKGVDWALDISAAKFAGGVTFEAIPGDLIRRNPEIQVLLTRDRLSKTDWQAVDFDQTAIDLALSWFLQGSLFDSVVVAARDEPKWAKRDVAVLDRLRAKGIAERD